MSVQQGSGQDEAMPGRAGPGAGIGRLRIRPGMRLGWIVAAVLAGLAPAVADTLSGSALIRERIALPPGVTFEAVIEDVSRADAPATVLGRTILESPGQPPVAFAIDYDPADLDPRAVYALRASIRDGETLLFTTDTLTRVLADDSPDSVEVILKMVARSETSSEMPPLGAHGLRLPATFRGTLPCADCEGIRVHLDLWPEQYYHMRREWLGRSEEPLVRDEIGRWHGDPQRGAIVFTGASEMPLFWEVKSPDRLRQMDMEGRPIVSSLPYDLTSDGPLEPTELAGLFLTGRMTYIADAALFEECFSGQRYPISAEGDYPALERAYLAAQAEPGAPLLVYVEGGLAPRAAMEGPDRTSLVVDRFIEVLPGESCPAPVPTASLTETYWRIDSLQGEPVSVVPGRREPHIVLRGDADRSFRATVGCNQMIGCYALEGDAISLGAAASTLMACPPPLDALERSLRAVLDETRALRLDGQRLHLLDASGTVIAELTAVYLP